MIFGDGSCVRLPIVHFTCGGEGILVYFNFRLYSLCKPACAVVGRNPRAVGVNRI